MNRRNFIQGVASSITVAASVSAAPVRTPRPRRVINSAAPRGDTLTVGVIGCGGRGSGAAANILEASPDTKIIALGDAFPDRLASSRENLAKLGERGTVAESSCFTGLDAYKAVLATDCDVVILATPPGFRPIHFAAAVEAGKHVFAEKPVAVDAPGIRSFIDSAHRATERKLSVVAGTQRRHEACYLEAMDLIHNGAIGRPLSARVFWNMGGLWSVEPRSDRSDVENQMRNWLYYTWLSGDHIVEQHVHNLDVANWAFEGLPTHVVSVGGRQARTAPIYGNIFDHFGSDLNYGDGRFALSMARQQEGTPGRVEEFIHGEKGVAFLTSGSARIEGENPWQFSGKQRNPYVQEHIDLIASIRGGAYLNEAERVAQSTMTAIMCRMAAYTGAELDWGQALGSTELLMPQSISFGPLAVAPVAIPGKTVFA